MQEPYCLLGEEGRSGRVQEFKGGRVEDLTERAQRSQRSWRRETQEVDQEVGVPGGTNPKAQPGMAVPQEY
jgi:hypothetical protein